MNKSMLVSVFTTLFNEMMKDNKMSVITIER